MNNIFVKNNTIIISTDTNNHKSANSLQILAGVMSDNQMHISEPVQSNYVLLTSNQTMESQRLKVLKYIQTYRTFYIQYQEWTVAVQTTEKSENLILMEPCKVFLKIVLNSDPIERYTKKSCISEQNVEKHKDM